MTLFQFFEVLWLRVGRISCFHVFIVYHPHFITKQLSRKERAGVTVQTRLKRRYCPRPLEGRGHVTLARGDSNTLRVHRAPLNSGFSRKSRKNRLEFRAGLYCNEATEAAETIRKDSLPRLSRSGIIQNGLFSHT